MTIKERLLKRPKEELWQTRLLFADETETEESLKPASRKEMAECIEQGLRANLPLVREIVGYYGLMELKQWAAAQTELTHPLSGGAVAQDTLRTLQRLGLAYRTRTGWALDPLVLRLPRITRPKLEELRGLYEDFELVSGILDRYGMLPEKELLPMLRTLTGEDWADEYLWEVMVVRRGLEVSWRPDDTEEAYFVSDLLRDPEALYRRLNEPALRGIDRAPCTMEDIGAWADGHRLSGSRKRYEGLTGCLLDRGIDEFNVWAAIEAAARVLQEDPGGTALQTLLLPLLERGMEPEPGLLEPLQVLLDAIPRWYDLGWSDAELTRLVAPARSGSAGAAKKPGAAAPGGKKRQ